MKFLDRCRMFHKVMLILTVITGAWTFYFWGMALLDLIRTGGEYSFLHDLMRGDLSWYQLKIIGLTFFFIIFLLFTIFAKLMIKDLQDDLQMLNGRIDDLKKECVENERPKE